MTVDDRYCTLSRRALVTRRLVRALLHGGGSLSGLSSCLLPPDVIRRYVDEGLPPLHSLRRRARRGITEAERFANGG
ncbi:hypothetical protein [Streptomyces mangrovisoli]|uniref:Uncharacterized protein n=1 Tax=Streptomyces mangrovisoli TaxID=1428628 RepID=A0A1J4NT19_9ACTN|nr:hypothetical protein [Streptomyces mangrovisoli]OIJ65483.1 hypothetical protein WN71_023340 [Streptomyces mangrovisoli]